MSKTEEIRTCEREVVSAILNADVAKLERVLAPEFVYTASEIGRRSRQEWLDGIASYRLGIFEIIEMAIDVYGEVAVVHARIHQDATIHDLPREGHFLITDVWACREGAWRLITRTSIAAP